MKIIANCKPAWCLISRVLQSHHLKNSFKFDRDDKIRIFYRSLRLAEWPSVRSRTPAERIFRRISIRYIDGIFFRDSRIFAGKARILCKCDWANTISSSPTKPSFPTSMSLKSKGILSSTIRPIDSTWLCWSWTALRSIPITYDLFVCQKLILTFEQMKQL